MQKIRTKHSALARICNILTLELRRNLMKTFIEFQFDCCPSIRIFCGRKLNNQINHLHERAVRIVYNDYESTIQKLLELYNSAFIKHRKNRLQQLNYIKIICPNYLTYET